MLLLGDILRRHAAVRGDKTAYVIGADRVTYGAFHARSNQLARALARLGVAYEELDESRGDLLEERLFGPVQKAYGRLRRAHSSFAGRSGLPARSFEQPDPPAARTRTPISRFMVRNSLRCPENVTLALGKEAVIPRDCDRRTGARAAAA